ncbi:MAG TPA: aldo/keto reductase [Patescibacteria group bacterium]|nr:aldo/keto reductase [Patescibacteria group bacterium]
MNESDKKISRRSFIGRGTAGIIGAGIGLTGTAARLTGASPPQQSAEPADPQETKPMIREYRRLGRFGWKVSDISFGNAGMQDPSTLEYAIERGINYVDTARQYYDMEKIIGQIFPSKRDKVFVTTKLDPPVITADVSEEAVTKAVDESLERLNTDYIDCCLIHSVGDPNLGDRTRIENPNIYRAFEKAKKAGKIKGWGASSHGPEVVEEFTWLIENTDIDMIMPGMNFMTKGLEPVLAKAKEKDIAVVAMKTLSAAKKIVQKEYRKDNALVRRLVLKWMLAQPNVDTLAITMRTFEQIDDYVSVSGQRTMTEQEQKMLIGYGRAIDREYCRPGCGGCITACPHGVPIHDILRYRLYYESYEQEKYAMQLYSRLPAAHRAERCRACSGSCLGTCPFDIAIRSKLIEAHSMLTLC